MPKAIVWVRVNEIGHTYNIFNTILHIEFTHLWALLSIHRVPTHTVFEGHSRDCVGVGGGGGASLIWPNRVCDADQGMEFRILSPTTEYSVASFTFSILNRVSFWTGRQCKEVMTCIYLWCQVFFLQKKKLMPWFHFEKKNT